MIILHMSPMGLDTHQVRMDAKVDSVEEIS